MQEEEGGDGTQPRRLPDAHVVLARIMEALSEDDDRAEDIAAATAGTGGGDGYLHRFHPPMFHGLKPKQLRSYPALPVTNYSSPRSLWTGTSEDIPFRVALHSDRKYC